MQRQRGLTLLELLVVLVIIGLAVAGVSLSLRDSNQTQLEREAQRLVAILESARAQSRTNGVALIWQATPDGFVIRPTLATNPAQGNNPALTSMSRDATSPIAARPSTWLATGTQAVVSTAAASTNNTTPANVVVLGPEPILTPARITLNVVTPNNTKPAVTLSIGTDGLKPFQVVP
jgi:general secretion pathway protein H